MPRHDLSIAVTGLNSTDNPGPGVSVARALRAHPDFRGRVIGLTYEALDPGLYAHDLGLACAFLLPYPSQGAEALRGRLREVWERCPFEVLIPNLDSELPAFIASEPFLRELGVRMYLPTRAQLDQRAKPRLPELCRDLGLDSPETRTVAQLSDLAPACRDLDFPVMVKGPFYGAQLARNLDEAVSLFHRSCPIWGLPMLVQRVQAGEEFDVMAVGDGQGGLVGAVPIRKLAITERGKGWAGVVVNDPSLIEITRRFMQATRWRGPCELELIRSRDERYWVIEINPRFPAWAYLGAGAGQNLTYAVAQLAMGEDPGSLSEPKVGAMFVRIALDQLTSIEEFQQIAATGEQTFATRRSP
jgi:carbamoyl-phosphate synthase large subunit